MTHIQTIPARQTWWQHLQFQGVREGVPGDNHPAREFAIIYAPFGSEEDAEFRRNPGTPHCHLRAPAPLVDRFFWDSDLNQYTQTESQVGAFLVWYLTGNPTQAELDLCPEMEANRKAMAGTPMFNGAFVVTELPEEREQNNAR